MPTTPRDPVFDVHSPSHLMEDLAQHCGFDDWLEFAQDDSASFGTGICAGCAAAQESGVDPNPIAFGAIDWSWYLMALSAGDPMFDDDLNPVFADEGSKAIPSAKPTIDTSAPLAIAMPSDVSVERSRDRNTLSIACRTSSQVLMNPPSNRPACEPFGRRNAIQAPRRV